MLYKDLHVFKLLYKIWLLQLMILTLLKSKLDSYWHNQVIIYNIPAQL